MIASGGGCLPLTDARTSSNDDTIAVLKPACSRAALVRTAGSKSSVVIKTRSAMGVRCVRRGACGVRRVGAGDQLDGMIQEAVEYRQSFLHAIRGTREIDDQRFPTRAGATTRQPGTWKRRARRGAQGFRDPFSFALEDCRGGFGG